MERYVIGNLKMNLLTQAERDRYLGSLESELKKTKLGNSKIVLCPPFVHLEKFVETFEKEKIEVGVQNIFAEERGSFTGEISPVMVKNFGGTYVIVGHSERRKYFGETNESSNEKIKLCLKNGLRPIYCVGESLEERERDMTLDIIVEQLGIGLAEVPSTQVDKLVIAYEPVWAVGTDEVPEGNDIMEVKILIRKVLSEMYGLELAEKVPILYGGSVKSKTVKQVCLDPGMDGVLVGRESLIPVEFLKIASEIDKN